MINGARLIAAATDEIERPTLGSMEQFLEIHEAVYKYPLMEHNESNSITPLAIAPACIWIPIRRAKFSGSTKWNYLAFLTLIILLFATCSCQSDATFFEEPGSYYQVVMGREAILIAKNTDGDQRRELQLYTLDGDLTNMLIMRNSRYEITNWKGDTIEITFPLNKSEFNDFKLEVEEHDTSKFDAYQLKFNYRHINEYTKDHEFYIDSIYSYNNKLKIFSRRKLIANLPLNKVTFFKESLVYEDYHKGHNYVFNVKPNVPNKLLVSLFRKH